MLFHVCERALTDWAGWRGLGVSGEMCVSALFGRRVYDYRFVKTQATLLAIKSSSSCCPTICCVLVVVAPLLFRLTRLLERP